MEQIAIPCSWRSNVRIAARKKFSTSAGNGRYVDSLGRYPGFTEPRSNLTPFFFSGHCQGADLVRTPPPLDGVWRGVAWDLKIGYSSETATQAPGHGLRSIVSCCYVCRWALGWLRMREAQVTALGLCFCLASLRETEYLLSWALGDGGALSSLAMTPVIVRKMGGSFFFFFPLPLPHHVV